MFSFEPNVGMMPDPVNENDPSIVLRVDWRMSLQTMLKQTDVIWNEPWRIDILDAAPRSNTGIEGLRGLLVRSASCSIEFGDTAKRLQGGIYAGHVWSHASVIHLLAFAQRCSIADRQGVMALGHLGREPRRLIYLYKAHRGLSLRHRILQSTEELPSDFSVLMVRNVRKLSVV